MTTRAALAVVASCLLLAASACSSDTTPSSSSLNLAGTWVGNTSRVDGAGKTITTPVTATMFQSSSNITGNLTVTAGNGVAIPGTLSGVLAGSSLALTMTFPTGAYLGVGSATCSSSATLSGSATATTISGTLIETFAAPCLGTITSVSTQTEQLALTKQ